MQSSKCLWSHFSYFSNISKRYNSMMFKMKLDIDASLPYFGVELSCVCLMFTYRKKVMTYSYPKVNYSDPKVT